MAKLALGDTQRDGNEAGLIQKSMDSARDLYGGIPIEAGCLDEHLPNVTRKLVPGLEA